MSFRSIIATVTGIIIFSGAASLSIASDNAAVLEQSMSATLDLWREGRYEQLFDHLAHRGKTSRESFVKKMKVTKVKPACCWQKMENFKVLNEKRTEATVYVKVGLEGTPGTADSSTREFKLTHEEGVWKMQLSDIYAISEVTGKKGKHSSKKSKAAALHYNK
ncbi:MAG: hypothetical protein HY888_03120 [Deltaproteobacteria bacterium]|nr:hypothetical protein [Deltaproteobacteria bacterium]